MAEIIETVPNISEGRDSKKLNTLKRALQRICGIELLDFDSDADHNRTVITAISRNGFEPLSEFSKVLVSECRKMLDIKKHQGVHPRIGAVDLIPFIALKNCSIDDLLVPVKELANYLANEFHLPIYLYGYAAINEERMNLASFRNIGYERLKNLISTPKLKPDYGPSRVHETLGATAVGVRDVLIAYNINLASDNISIAKWIASEIREKDGGFESVRALGFFIKSKRCAQVSMNICDYKKTPLRLVYDKVAELANFNGVDVLESEIVGMAPPDSLTSDDIAHMKLKTPKLLNIT